MQLGDQKKLTIAGIGLIVLGVITILGLWWAVPVLLLGSVGGYVYVERRKEGRIVAAVQSGLWLVGLALLLLFDIMFPGILLLAGASLLLRGREPQADQQVVRLLARMRVHLPDAPGASPAVPYQRIATPTDQTDARVAAQPTMEQERDHGANTGETTRL
jgi:hypothetical protein